mmetsp:Transcript_34272/g.61174  ORF Transcript_34272/g.61174 Transcript_34272/m.61174 type:complete len:301 (-) Transcript_34272:148-1050(-)
MSFARRFHPLGGRCGPLIRLSARGGGILSASFASSPSSSLASLLLRRAVATSAAAAGQAALTSGPEAARSWGKSRAGRWAAAALGAAVVAAAGGRALSEAYRPDSVYLKGESEYIEMVKAVVGSDSVRALMTTTSLLSDESPVSDDHLFTNLLRNELVKDIHCFFDAETRQFHSVIGLGADVCGHPTIVHGGLTAAIMDEAFGGLIFCMKRWKMLDPGPPFTVKLEVNYHKPLKASTMIVCSTELESAEGRKVWMKANVVDSKTKEVYASGRALFVTPRVKVDKPWTLFAWAKSIFMFGM